MTNRFKFSLFVILLTSLNVCGQDDYYFNASDKGTLYLSAGTNFGLTRDADSEVTVLNIASNLGYFIINSFCVGGTVNLSYSDSEFGSATVWSAGPFARAYFGNSFLGAGLIISHLSGIDDQLAIQAEAGYPVFLTDHIAFEPTVSYLYSLEENGGSAFNLNFGFAFYFAGRPDY
jgi:hypothetical protein